MSSQSNAASSSSTLRTVFGRWGKVAFAERDLEAQTIVGAREHFLDIALPAPPAAYTHAPRTLPSQTEVDEEEGTDPVDDFFGVVRPSHPLRPVAGSQDSRHDAAHALVHHDDVPPPYTYASEPPAYSRVAEYPTLAMYLFKLGFLFPLFWLAGALILISPLRAPEDWELSKTEAERQELIETMRRAEVKWAKRCLLALSVFAVAVLVVVLTVVFVRRS
ncbi:hypothetical protein AcV7_001607 [Taiwanofungus camphoratus]|nr:hypothetical protein AcV7_001607 [Antrodia cinnamomea]